MVGLFLLITYIKQLYNTIKVQKSAIKEQKNFISKERIAHKYTKNQLNGYVKYINDIQKQLSHNGGTHIIELEIDDNPINNYNMDDILIEISKKGIKNIDKDKLEFLKNFGKNDTNKR